ncbi:ABC-type dipeptide/oligopeptide/nickel transport system ATPase component [Candidatus Brocadia sinica JPN1]|uniref:ABC-type dipeptide/oligopeptide/nickel transport system ATPase component n=1 Tax=Candidatus Brocadia sinica JPN1 TaxID=1197129 RepID=A0ABQ0JZZ6_9BACT|nr:ABC-type dipeptide/oligopeptide/nickel transport system ATPase component [Candidatus Brocadia sinica JPN1]GIK14359.1 MAG: hypothetical protein BroJett002_30660 [Candidatus Brocadia sinica]GJQ17128.1 MAG: hypothetical protein HBSIN01_10870 [Candidatus Brocadia sinica]
MCIYVAFMRNVVGEGLPRPYTRVDTELFLLKNGKIVLLGTQTFYGTKGVR